MNDRQMRLFKRAFMPLTPQAQEAAAAPMDPNAMPSQDPNAMPPQGAPIDPNMMPPQGAPMDPSMQGAPMDPNAMPPQGAPVSTGDPVIDMIMQMGAVIVDGSTGQPIPPEIIAQIAQEIQTQMGGAAAGTPPMDPNVPPTPNPEIGAMQETLAQMDKTISTVLDKIDSLRNVVDSMVASKEQSSNAEKDADQMDAEVAAVLAELAQREAVAAPPPEQMPPAPEAQGQLTPEQIQQLQLLEAMGQQQ